VSVVANVAINVDSRDAVSKLRQVESQAATTERAFGALQSALGALGVGFALTKVIADVKELDTNIRRLATVGVDVAKINPALSALSKELGGVASKAELAAASYQAASAGFSDTAGNVNILRAATKAAVGGLADTQAVTEVLVKTLNSYGMSGSQAIQVTDSISKAVELGNQEWSDYTSQLGRVASMAALAGVSLDETNAFIASATKNGATAEVAFTGLSAVLTQLLQPTKESQEAAAKLGVQWNLMGLQTKGLGGLMEELAAAIDKDKEAAARMVGPTEAMRGAFAAASKDGSDFKNILEQIGSAAGKTDADFQTMKGSLENTLKALDTSFKNLSEALGTAFGPTVVITVQDITKAVDGFADFMATVPQPVMNTAGELVKLIAQMLLLQKAIQAIIALRAAFIGAMASMTGATVASGTAATASASAFAMYTNNTRALQAQAATATPVLVGLRNVLSTIAAIGVITVAVNIAISGFQSLLAANAELDKLRGRKAAGGAAAMFAGSSKEEVSRQQAIARKTLEHEQKILKGLQSPGSRVAQFVNLGGVLEGLGVPSIQSASRREMQAKARIGSAQAVLGLNANRFPSATPAPVSNATGTPVGAAAGGGKGRGGKSDAEKAAEKAAREAEKLRQELERSLEVGDQLGTQFSRQAALLFEGSEIERKRLQIQFDFQDRAKQIAELKNAEQRTNLNQLNAEIQRLEIIQLQTEELKKQAEEAEKLFKAAFDAAEFGVDGEGTVVSGLSDAIAKLKEDLNPIKLQVDAIVGGATAIGNAFGTAFSDVISGAKSTQQALADAFKSIGDAFINMAAEIIAKQMTLIILQTILNALSGGGSALGTANKNLTGTGALKTPIQGLAIGGRAAGGPVTGGKPYIVGERGPELFLPSTGGNVMSNNDLRSAMGSGSAGGGAPVLNMSFQTRNIGGVEYVSRDQLEQAMAATRRQAASDGAKRGMTMTLDKLQQSPGTRSRVGLR
jgi:TP901 family phage tail tape measure protein